MGSQNRPKASQAASSRGNRTVQPGKHQKQTSLFPHEQHPSTASDTKTIEHFVPSNLQQFILNTFTQALPVVTRDDDFKSIMQEVKGHLYNRDFEAAFGKPEYLDVYAARWSAARALAYADMFTHPDHRYWFKMTARPLQPTVAKQDVVVEQVTPSNIQSPDDQTSSKNLYATESDTDVQRSIQSGNLKPTISGMDVHHTLIKVVCIGGGAGAEIVALAATIRYLQSENDKVGSRSGQLQSLSFPCHLEIHAIDIADWSDLIQRISTTVTTPPPLPDYASHANKDNNHALVDPDVSGVTVKFSQKDILQESSGSLHDTLKDVVLITIMFTLNELFSSSLAKTTSLLLNLTEAAQVGTHLVVVDSPGSYSVIKLNKPNQPNNSQSTKRYPMKWLLDHTLLDVAGKDKDVRWIKVEDEDSKWFRINDKIGLKYGVELENCRYQIHVFKKVS